MAGACICHWWYDSIYVLDWLLIGPFDPAPQAVDIGTDPTYRGALVLTREFAWATAS
jgi:hypothetical protein